MRNLMNRLRCIFYLLFLGLFMVNNTYAGAWDSIAEYLGPIVNDTLGSLSSMGSLADNISGISEGATQSLNQYIHTIGENAEINIDADIDADILQEISGEYSKGIIEILTVGGLNKDAEVNIDADINANIEQTVDGKNNYGAVHILRVGTPVK